jgi:hypothetical protein
LFGSDEIAIHHLYGFPQQLGFLLLGHPFLLAV